MDECKQIQTEAEVFQIVVFTRSGKYSEFVVERLIRLPLISKSKESRLSFSQSVIGRLKLGCFFRPRYGCAVED